MNDPIDYSRPVGWWCPVCGDTNHVSSIGADGRERQRFCIQSARTGFCFRRAIPRYLPSPEGQRPLVEDEVATGEAEVVTFQFDDDNEMAISSVHPRGGRRTMGVMRWPGISSRSIEIHINDCATASARARIATGSTE